MSYVYCSMAVIAPVFFHGVMHDIGWLAITALIGMIVLTALGIHLEEKQENKIKKLEKMVNDLKDAFGGKEETK